MKIDFEKMVTNFKLTHGVRTGENKSDDELGYYFRWCANHLPVPTIREYIEYLRGEFQDKAADAWKHPLDNGLSPDMYDNRDIEDACNRALALLDKTEEQVDLIDESIASIATRRNVT